MNLRSYTAVYKVYMVEDDLLGEWSAVHVREVSMIIGVGMPFKLQACHIDMEGHKSILILHACTITCLRSSERADPVTYIHVYKIGCTDR